MTRPRSRPGRTLPGGPLAASLAIHALAALLLWWGGPRLRHPEAVHVRLVRQAGGGDNRPGWVSDSPASEAPAAAQEEVAPEPEPVPEPQVSPSAKQPVVARTPDPRGKPATPSREPERPRRESDAAVKPGEASDGRRRGGSDPGAGPRGAGGSRTGATADQPGLEGMSQYLLRLENNIQRAFKYPARGSGRKAVFHFLVDRHGRVEQLEQTAESGLPGLDLAGKSALTRAVLPPLPPAFPYDKIGVTFTFVDE